jgi:hypothetical protein
MRLAWLCTVFVAVGCANSIDNTGFSSPDPNAPPDPNKPAGPQSPDPGENTPHSLGSILLGETRTGDNPAQSTPVITATFVPDSKRASLKTCGQTFGKCEVQLPPQCTTGGVTGCATGERCTYDDKCAPKCVATCTASCKADEECFLSSPGVPECRPKPSFDAGALAFHGTTQAITLFPPYTVQATGLGAPFLAKSEVRVQASGAIETGFATFDEKFTTTSFMLTKPALAKTDRAVVFGTGSIPLGWQPGNDEVVITVTGSRASAKCEADDASGKFEVPREIVREVTVAGVTATALSITVARQRREIRKNLGTVGTLGGKPIDRGWLELVTVSAESANFQPLPTCATNYTLCTDRCVYLMSDAQNCGACGRRCVSPQICSSGVCR